MTNRLLYDQDVSVSAPSQYHFFNLLIIERIYLLDCESSEHILYTGVPIRYLRLVDRNSQLVEGYRKL
jgi:hypothetical protein